MYAPDLGKTSRATISGGIKSVKSAAVFVWLWEFSRLMVANAFLVHTVQDKTVNYAFYDVYALHITAY